ncbi:MAG: hypothetical protein HOF96_13165 [Candidatus Marinimicrobia bacterium]|nr:hypothetical protein [Candidatus Neomarinimicrobiota bacterium]MBT6760551.1 hypothetical protein [Candidatus Neomarinimicrobiota bacterium]
MKIIRLKHSLTGSVLAIMMLCSCEPEVNIEVGVLWEDDQYFNDSGSACIGILGGKWDSDTGFDGTILDTTSVRLGVNGNYKFSIIASESDNYTAFIYFEHSGNEIYDEGYDIVMGYKYNKAEPGKTVEISLSAYY